MNICGAEVSESDEIWRHAPQRVYFLEKLDTLALYASCIHLEKNIYVYRFKISDHEVRLVDSATPSGIFYIGLL